MEPAVLKIYGDIGEPCPMCVAFGEAEPISSKFVSEFLDANKDATEITVRINSRGGDVQEGWAIYDLLTASGKRIKTVGEGKIYSIATIVFLAGTEREIMKNADGLIHNPFIPPFTLADSYDSEELQKLAEGLKQEEAKILDFYVEKTGHAKDELEQYMNEDTKLSAEDMLTLGFATKIVEPVMAYAYIKPTNKFKMKEADVKSFGEKLDKLIAKVAAFSRLSSKNQVLTDIDGNELTLEKDTGVPAVGDRATPDGTFTMESGNIITVSGGVITAIEENTPPQSDLEKANAKIAELEAQIANIDKEKAEALAAKEAVDAEKEALNVEKETLNAEKEAVAAEAVKAAALVTELTSLKNTWKPDTRGKFSSQEKVGDVNMARVKELTDKIKTAKTE